MVWMQQGYREAVAEAGLQHQSIVNPQGSKGVYLHLHGTGTLGVIINSGGSEIFTLLAN